MENNFSSAIKKGSLVLGSAVLSIYTLWNIASNVPKVNAATPCIITLFGVKYDVSPLQSIHTGGNIFVCGTDMTSVYQSQHGTDVTRMIPYLLVTPTPTPTNTPTPTPVVTPNPSSTPTPTLTPTPNPSITPTPTISGKRDDTGQLHESTEGEINENEQESDGDRHMASVSLSVSQGKEETNHHD